MQKIRTCKNTNNCLISAHCRRFTDGEENPDWTAFDTSPNTGEKKCEYFVLKRYKD